MKIALTDPPVRFEEAMVGAGVGAAAGGTLVLAGWFAWRSGVLPRLAALVAPLFVRFDAEAARGHASRAQILAVVDAQPSVATEDLLEATGLNRGTLLYHLRMLERIGLMRSVRVGRARVWYRAGSPHARRVAYEHPPERRRLLEAIEQAPGLSLSELARSSRLPKSSVHRHLGQLAAAGAVRLRRERLRVRCYPAPS